jgi:glycosyltransferase involved in cell wall biosynthesis
MRIAIDLIASEFEPGGMLLATRALLHGLAQTDTNNEYIVLTVRPDEYRAFEHTPNVRVHAVSLPTRRGVLVQHQLFSSLALQKVKPDVLHVPAFAAPVSWRGPLVVTINDLAFLKVPEQSWLYPRLYHKYVQRAGARRAQRVIAISEQTVEELTTLWHIPHDRIRLIHHALRPSLQPQEIGASANQRMHELYGPRYLLHVGRIMPRKNVERLIEAYFLLADRFPDLHLVLTGGLGYGSEQAVQLIETSTYKDRIHLAGWVSEEDLAPLYANASALVFPSKHEGQGLPTLEAMACGAPVVASYEAASQEIAGKAVVRADCSQAAPLAQAITRVLSDQGLRAQLIQAGYQQAKPFQPQNCARQTVSVYEETFSLYHDRQSNRTNVA